MARKNLLKGFKKPKGITFEHLETNPNYGKFIAYPFEPGFGTTIGNTLRRVLLSSIQGYAVTSVRITSFDAEGVPRVIQSEFDSIANVSEDTLEILNSLKMIRFKLPNDAEQDTLLFEFKGPGKVTSNDFEKEGQLEVLSKDVPVFTMMEGANLSIEIQVDLGRGYIPAEVNSNYVEVVGTIPMDAIFSPVRKVKYAIEPCRVGERNDYDKLVLEIWSDGTISPEDALAEAAKIAERYVEKYSDSLQKSMAIAPLTDLKVEYQKLTWSEYQYGESCSNKEETEPYDIAEEWAEEFGDGDYDDGYDDAYDYWESERD